MPLSCVCKTIFSLGYVYVKKVTSPFLVNAIIFLVNLEQTLGAMAPRSAESCLTPKLSVLLRSQPLMSRCSFGPGNSCLDSRPVQDSDHVCYLYQWLFPQCLFLGEYQAMLRQQDTTIF